MPRPQFSIRTVLWLTLVVAAFLGGIVFEKERAKRNQPEELPPPIWHDDDLQVPPGPEFRLNSDRRPP